MLFYNSWQSQHQSEKLYDILSLSAYHSHYMMRVKVTEKQKAKTNKLQYRQNISRYSGLIISR